MILLYMYRGVAQLVEQRSSKPQVVGSNPITPARYFLVFYIREFLIAKLK
jgi:hypothetical protein